MTPCHIYRDLKPEGAFLTARLALSTWKKNPTIVFLSFKSSPDFFYLFFFKLGLHNLADNSDDDA